MRSKYQDSASLKHFKKISASFKRLKTLFKKNEFLSHYLEVEAIKKNNNNTRRFSAAENKKQINKYQQNL
jgi:hypothetical protein